MENDHGEGGDGEQTQLSRKRSRLTRFAVILLILAAVTVVFFLVFRSLGLLDPETLTETLNSMGYWAHLMFIGMFLLQAMCLFMIPGNTTLFITAAGLLFDDFWPMFISCVIGVWLAGIALFFFGRYGGRRIVYWAFDKEKVDEKLEWLSTKGAKMLPLFFLVPFMPNDMICMVCGISKLKFWKFLLIIIPFRVIEVLIILSYPHIISFFLG